MAPHLRKLILTTKRTKDAKDSDAPKDASALSSDSLGVRVLQEALLRTFQRPLRSFSSARTRSISDDILS